MSALTRWLEERVPISGDDLRELTNEPVPNHLRRWWFCLGGTPAYLFVVQIATGILLAVYYQPSAVSAYESVRFISEEAAYGWYLRSLHKWGATFMIAAVVLHQMRVFFTGAYRKPRELNWIVGMCLLLCTLALGFTGYSLVYEQLSFWGATVGANITDSVPIIGGFLKNMLLAGEQYNERTLSRFFVLHAAVLPVAMVGLLAVHIALIRLVGVTEFEFEEDRQRPTKHFNFYPDHLLTEGAIGLALMILLTTLAIVFPAEVGPRAQPLVTPEIIKPEWYFYAAFRWLKLFPETVAVFTTGLAVFLMFVWPLIDARIRRSNRTAEVSVWVGVAAVLTIIGLTIWEAAVAH
ncbi:MAG: cytochrome bc complex cytochrome b subunit [Proteobacteria bacterium]|nr:cytochrome bc complex cytochrome b subunit [Pseudomonadota bacterium]